MQVKHFYIRVSKVHTEDDETLLNDFLRDVQVVTINASLINASTNYWSILVFYKEGEPVDVTSEVRKEHNIKDDERESLTDEQERVFQHLKAWRTEKVAQESVPAYVIAHNETLRQIALQFLSIQNKEDLSRIKQFDNKKAQKYGDEILSILRECADQDEISLFDDE